MADARAKKMPLFGGGEGAIHDWEWMFKQSGVLQYDTAIGGVVWWIGIVIMLIALAWLGFDAFRLRRS